MLVTVGLVHNNDFNGAWQTLIGLLANHSAILAHCEFVIVDNNPGSRDGKALRNFTTRIMRSWPCCGTRYIAFAESIGSAPARNELFNAAAGDFVLCLDPHVTFPNHVLEKLFNYVNDNPESSDLLTGPIVMDDGSTRYTCQKRQWTSANFGVWDCDERGLDSENDPFEIDQQGLGVFCIKRSAWPGFHKDLRGFGCVEAVLCEKIRRAGAKVLCLPFLRWYHRFSHYMKTVPYPVSNYDKARNHLIAFQEVDWDTKPILDHFRYYLSVNEWKRLLIEFRHLDFEKMP